MWWWMISMVSKVEERSRRTNAKTFLLSMAKSRSFWIRSKAVSVEWKGLYAEWNGDKEGKDLRWLDILVWMIRSIFFEIKLRLDIGR